MGVHVPHDIVSNYILPNVPAKSVCRFKCVSNEWRSLLTSDVFQSNHNRLHLGHHNNNLKLLVLSKTDDTSIVFTTIDCETPPSDKDLTPTRRQLLPFKGITPRSIRILASFHGLVCLGIGINEMDFSEFASVILWNPLTNEYKVLSKLCNYIRYSDDSVFGMYYSCCDDDYKFLFVDFRNNIVCIYSLTSGSLRKVDAFQTDYIGWIQGTYWRQRGTYLNENLYFLQQSFGRLRSIIRYDTKTEVLSKIETRNMDDDLYSCNNYDATLMVKSDCIHVFVKYDTRRGTSIKLWKLDEYENLKEVVSYQLLKPRDHPIRWMDPFHLMKNGNWLMIHYTHEGRRIYKVDLKEKKHVKDKSNICDHFKLYPSVRLEDINVTFFDKVGYIETFVSPHLYDRVGRDVSA